MTSLLSSPHATNPLPSSHSLINSLPNIQLNIASRNHQDDISLKGTLYLSVRRVLEDSGDDGSPAAGDAAAASLRNSSSDGAVDASMAASMEIATLSLFPDDDGSINALGNNNSSSPKKPLYQQALFAGLDLLLLTSSQFGFKCDNQYITVQRYHQSAAGESVPSSSGAGIEVFVENVRFVQRCLAMERIKIQKDRHLRRKEQRELEAGKAAAKANGKKKKKRKHRKLKSLFRKKKKHHKDADGHHSDSDSDGAPSSISISKPTNVQRHASYGEEKGFVPWEYLPQDYHPMLIANGITEQDWNLYGAELMPVLTDFSSRTKVDSVRIGGEVGTRNSVAEVTPGGVTTTPLGTSGEATYRTTAADELPEGWTQHYDEDEQLYYYFNEIHDYSQWEFPREAAENCTEAAATPLQEETPFQESMHATSTTPSPAGAGKRVSFQEPASPISSTPPTEALEKRNSAGISSTTTPVTASTPKSAASFPTAHESTEGTPTLQQPPTPVAGGPPPPPPPIAGLEAPPQISVTSGDTSGTGAGAPPPAPPMGNLTVSLPKESNNKRSSTLSAATTPSRRKPATPATRPPDLLASIRQFSKANLRHVDPEEEHKAPDLSKMHPNQKLSLMEVLKSRLTDLRDRVEGTDSSSSDDDDSDVDSDDSW